MQSVKLIEFLSSFLFRFFSTKIIKGPEAGEKQVKTNVTMACEVLWDHSYELSITWKKNNVELAIGKEVCL